MAAAGAARIERAVRPAGGGATPFDELQVKHAPGMLQIIRGMIVPVAGFTPVTLLRQWCVPAEASRAGPSLAFRSAAIILRLVNALSPLVSEFDTVEQAEAHLRWLEAKVAAARADHRPTVEHDEAMARVRAIIEAKAAPKA